MAVLMSYSLQALNKNLMPKKVIIIDSTLRDGSHAVKHRFTKENIISYSKGAEEAGITILVVGHGNGLGASSLQLGKSLLSDHEMLTAAKKSLKKTKLGAFFIPGFGTIKNDLLPAIDIGIDVLFVASHCTEANITREHIEFARKKNVEVYGVLMMSHMLEGKELAKQAKLMQQYGVKGVILMDSAGALLPGDVNEKIKWLVGSLDIDVGFHAHNNLGMGIANTITAINCGATLADCTSRGLGAGAGNCQLEVLVAVLHKMNIETGLDLFKLIDNSEIIVSKIMQKPQEIAALELVSGLAGVFSGFAPHARKAAENFNVDVRQIIFELGKRKVIAGQEDIIVDVANFLKNQKFSLKK